MNTATIRILLAMLTLAVSGCSTTAKRAAVTGLGAGAGGAAGYALAPKGYKGVGAAAGALVGGVGTALAQGEDKELYQRGVDDGYVAASSDDVKKLYWAKQALEKKAEGEDGATRYYIFEDEGTTADGRKLAPEKVAIPVYEPTRK